MISLSRRRLRPLVWLGLVVLAAAASLWLTRVSSPSLVTSIAVSRTPLSAPIYIATERGYFRDEGVDVTLQEINGGVLSFAKVSNEEADFGTCSDSVLMFRGFDRNDVVNLATFVRSDNDVKIVTYGDRAIASAADLAGRRVGVTRGSAGEYLLSAYLALEQVPSDQVALVDLPPNRMQTALDTGDIDAAATWEPYIYEIHKARSDARLLPTQGLYALSFNLVARRELVAERRDTVLGVLRALRRAIAFIGEEPQQARSIVRQRLGLQPDFVEWALRDYLFILSLNQAQIMHLESLALWAMQKDLVESEQMPPFANLVEAGPLREIQPQAVSFGF
jgi:NitT/TauT family transport system substrate-binding protein